MNKYLEKIASWKNPAKFLGYVSGQRKAKALTKVRNMEEAIANKHTLDDLNKNYAKEIAETTKARIATGAAVTGVAAGGLYGYKKLRDKQKQETLERYKTIFNKQANATGAAAKTLLHSGASALGKTLRTVGRTTADLMNTAGGGKIKDYAIRHGVKVDSDAYTAFNSTNNIHKQKNLLLKSKPGSSGKVHRQSLKDLHRNKRDARIALGSGLAAGVSAYGWKKSRDQLKKNNPYQ